jgi:two-component system, OmpR family, response regulator
MKILYIEDDKSTSDYVKEGLESEGHSVDLAPDGREGLWQGISLPYDIIIIDRRLPGLDGLSIVKSLRAANVVAPLLFLTTMDGVDDRVEGLEAGADDYLVKPFAFSELLARLNALARRPPVQKEQTSLKVGGLEMNLLSRVVHRDGQKIDLLPREYSLLEYLMRNAGRVVTRNMLLEQVWDFHFDPKTNVVETHISRLRTKIDKPFGTPLLQTVRGAGYMINAFA